MSIEEVPGRRVATIVFRGRTAPRTVRRRTEDLMAVLKAESIRPKGDHFLMRYNPPFTPGFMRRNEIGVEIES